MLAPLAVCEMSNLPELVSVTPLDAAMLPAPDKANVPPLIAVSPL